LSVGEPDGDDTATYSGEAVVALLMLAVLLVFGYDTLGIRKSVLSQIERDAMFLLVLYVFASIPFKRFVRHVSNIPSETHDSNIIMWLLIWVCVSSANIPA